MISKRILNGIAVTAIAASVATHVTAQVTSICPTNSIPPNNSLPRVIFPSLPIAGQPWQACYQNPAACEFSGFPGVPSSALEIVAGPAQIALKTQWSFVSFSPCPDTAYRTANMPAVAQAGPITIRLLQRTAESLANAQLVPFIQTFEQVIQVRAPAINSIGVPGLDWRAVLGLSVLMIGVAGMYRRR